MRSVSVGGNNDRFQVCCRLWNLSRVVKVKMFVSVLASSGSSGDWRSQESEICIDAFRGGCSRISAVVGALAGHAIRDC